MSAPVSTPATEKAVLFGGLPAEPHGRIPVHALVSAFGGALLTHSHTIGNVRAQLLIERSHVPLAGVGAGWRRAGWPGQAVQVLRPPGGGG